MPHPALTSGRVAVITGAASGIGLAAATQFAGQGMKVCLSDLDEPALERAAAAVTAAAPAGAESVLSATVDVGDQVAMAAFKDRVYDAFGECALLFNNAVTRVGGSVFASHEGWRRAVDVNLWGVINGVQAFVPSMIEQGTPSVVVNAGSKQGITMPPGNSAYNVTKAAMKAYTELLAYELRNTGNCQISVHLLIPGWTTTGDREHKPGAWLPPQVVTKLVDSVERGDFYILCPDNEVTTAMDHKRILWAAGDIVNNRPPLSRWHEEHADAFVRFQSGEMNINEAFPGV